jgi:ssDNA-binding Zn-finger/Zn-ribbon topoisomerase 1
MPKDIRCPVCNSTTVVQTVEKGPDTGRKFHVCTRYPECEGRIKAHKGLLHQFRNYKVIIPVILLMVVLIATVVLILGFNIKITEEPINRSLDAKFPITRSVGNSMNITLDNARIELTRGEELVLVYVDVDINLKTGEMEELIEVNGIIRSEFYYGRGSRGVFLKNSELLNLDIGDIVIADMNILSTVAEDAIRAVLNEYPVYTVKSNNFLYTIAIWFLRDIRVEDGFILIRAGL